MAKILVTGCAGFIGFHVARRLAERHSDVLGLDNLNPYYDVSLKQARLAQLSGHPNFRFAGLDLADREGMADLFRKEKFEVVVHLAAQAGVRHSPTNPHSYQEGKLLGLNNLLEALPNHTARYP